MTTELDVKVDNKVKAIKKEPSNYTVILLNDDVTPMDFVIELIVKIFRHTPETAKDLTLKIHKEGSAVVGIYTCLLYTSPSPRDGSISRMPSSA